MSKRSAEEILRSLEEPSSDEEMERVLSMTDEEVNAELAAAGYTPEELAAQEEAMFGPAPAKPASKPANVIPIRPRRSRPLWASVAAAAAVFGPVGLLAATEVLEPLALVGAAPDAGGEVAVAQRLRIEAAGALEAGQWARALELLDDAKEKDPKGDEAPAVKSGRRIANEKLGRAAPVPR